MANLAFLLSATASTMGYETDTAGVWRKDFVRTGKWNIPGQDVKLVITPARIKKWEKTFELMQSKGHTIPLTIDHRNWRDPETGKLYKQKLKPNMTEAKIGKVVNLFAADDRGMFDVIPADDEAKDLMNRCPEVSLELRYDYTDTDGTVYDEAITAITLTPDPVILGQLEEWELVGEGEEDDETADTLSQAQSGRLICLSATQEKTMPEEKTAEVAHKTGEELAKKPFKFPVNDSQGEAEHAVHMSRLRKAMKMPEGETSDHHVLGKCAEHMEMCRGVSNYMSKEDHEKALAEAVSEATAKVTTLSKELETVKADGLKMTDIDDDTREILSGSYKTRIENLGTKATPAQKALLLSKIVGDGKSSPVCLSRKAARSMGLPAPVAEILLEVFEAGNPAEMAKLLQEQSGGQGKAVELSKPTAADISTDPDVTKRMIDSVNGKATGTFVL